MLANIITLTRLMLTYGIILFWGRHRNLDFALLATIVIVFALDAVDGSVARKRKETSEIGALFDTIADRVIENTFWIYFAAIGVIPMWMPITVIVRGVVTGNLKHRRVGDKNGWVHVLTHSRISRALYGIVKMLTFVSLASTTFIKNPVFRQGGLVLAILAVGFCLIRGAPVILQIGNQFSCAKNLSP